MLFVEVDADNGTNQRAFCRGIYALGSDFI